MKLIRKIRFPKNWKTASTTGYILTAIGLIAGVVLVGQLAAAIVNAQPPHVSSLVLAAEATSALLLVITGFALMVAGADPFEDASDQFSFIQQDQQWDAPVENNERAETELTKV